MTKRQKAVNEVHNVGRIDSFAQLCARFESGECGSGRRQLRDFGQLLKRYRARTYYRKTKDTRRRLAREGAQRRRWGAWLLQELRAEWMHEGR